MNYSNIKRIVDLFCAVFATIILSPILAILAFVIKQSMGRPILFEQNRPGKNGEIFKMYKFRTMRETTDINGKRLPDKERLTRIGNFLRKTSLDELPELINIIRGEMSLVGPRPLLSKYLERYTPFQMRRHEVKPGLTGWAQINGRNAIDWKKKFQMDVWYVDNVSFLLDVKIILLTIKKVVLREGISADGEATMPEFNPKKAADN